MEKQEFIEILKSIAARDTSADPEGWSENNPLWGHCAVVALLAQDIFGGDLMRGSLAHIPKYMHVRSHYWNRLTNGEENDFTSEQYPDLNFHTLVSEVRERDRVLGYPDTLLRANLLKQRFNSKRSGI